MFRGKGVRKKKGYEIMTEPDSKWIGCLLDDITDQLLHYSGAVDGDGYLDPTASPDLQSDLEQIIEELQMLLGSLKKKE